MGRCKIVLKNHFTNGGILNKKKYGTKRNSEQEEIRDKKKYEQKF